MKTILICLLLLLPSIAQAEILSTHFDKKEFACKCCGLYIKNKELLFKLELLRARLNKPIIITSGTRCIKHNKEVGGVSNSQHTKGKAVDIKVKGVNPKLVAQEAKKCGFTWIKVYSTWTHIDTR